MAGGNTDGTRGVDGEPEPSGRRPLPAGAAAVAEVVAAVRGRARYAVVAPDMVARIAARELAARRSARAAAEATRRKLHQVLGTYWDGPRAEADLERLTAVLGAAARAGDPDRLRAACAAAMRLHASSRERVDHVAAFYDGILAVTGRPRVLLDIACGLNPLALPWMGLAAGAHVIAYDADQRVARLLNGFFASLPWQADAVVHDVLAAPPVERADVALLLKAVPCLEQQVKGGAMALVAALAADWVVVSFPTRTLSGRQVAMAAHYETLYGPALRRYGAVEVRRFPGELVFLLDKRRGTAAGEGGAAGPAQPIPAGMRGSDAMPRR